MTISSPMFLHYSTLSLVVLRAFLVYCCTKRSPSGSKRVQTKLLPKWVHLGELLVLYHILNLPIFVAHSLSWYYSFPFLIGIVVSAVMFSVVESSVNTVIVCFAEGPAEFEQNHPELSEDMRDGWRKVYPNECGFWCNSWAQRCLFLSLST